MYIKKYRVIVLVVIFQIIFFMSPFFSQPAKADIIDNFDDLIDPVTEAIIGATAESTSIALEHILESLGLGMGPFKDIGESMNSLSNKKQAPEVELLFSPVSPKLGDEITATALPKFFKTSKESLYFTWYLKHKEGNIDHNEDGDIDIEDYKIEASKILVNDGFRHERADYYTTADSDDDDDGFGPLEDFIQSGMEDMETRVPFGGSSVKKPVGGFRCYVNDYEEGIIYEIVEESVSGEECVNSENPEECATSPSSICTHLFPHAIDNTTGDGEFTGEEEEFWKTNPNDPDTVGDGMGDEAAVAGVGRDKISWTYNTGDEIGVVIEGESMTHTKHADSSYMVMWALPKNIFRVEGSSSACEISDKGSYLKEVNGRFTEIETAEVDINACLEENLIDPLEGGQPKNIEVDLSASPNNPFNNSSGEGNKNGDTVFIQSTISNASSSNTQNMYYRWTTEGNDTFTLNDEDWSDISNSINIGMTEGLNKDSVSFNLNMAEGSNGYASVFGGGNQGFIRVRLEAEENIDSGSTRYGTGEIVIKVTTGQNNQIDFSRAESIGGRLVFSGSGDAELCESDNDSVSSSVCAVANNEIVAARINSDSGLRNFSWTLNGEPIECTSSMSNECNNTSQSNTIFFPIVGNPGEQYKLDVFANDTNMEDAENFGTKTNISQVFQVVKPMVSLAPEGGIGEDCGSDGAGFSARNLGSYNDLNSDEEFSINACSSSVFEGSAGTLSVEASFNPSWIANYAEDIRWTVNGEEQTNSAGSTTLSYDASGITAGATVNVSVSGKYAQDNEIKRALMEHWDISQFNLSEARLNDSIKIKIGGNNNVTGSLKKSTNIMANLASNLPVQILFMFRMALTIITIIFISGTIFALGKQGA